MTDATPHPLGSIVDDLFRHHYGRMVAGLTRVFGPRRLELAEDVVQDALVRAIKVWPYQGVPDRPEAWLAKVAHRGAIDAVRRHALATAKLDELQRWAESAAQVDGRRDRLPDDVIDDSLQMIFLCCSPLLSVDAQVALTLKTLCGFGVPEIARALLSKEGTIAQRLTRARERLRRDDVAFSMPPPGAPLRTRLTAVLDVIYLLFNEGYCAYVGSDLIRTDLVREATRLASMLIEIDSSPDDQPRIHALLALMLLQSARLPARLSDDGDLLPLADQDRIRWDTDCLSAGFGHFEQSARGSELTAYHVEAAIAASYAAAPDYLSIDWQSILSHYDQLLLLRPDSPIVELNRAVVLAQLEGPHVALVALDRLESETRLSDYYLLPAVRAQLHWLIGDTNAAQEEFQRALSLPCTQPEHELLERRLRACQSGDPAPPL